ncbi:phospholipase B1, membrane-associated [Eurytemora carolleeae]|uniref:phospholipase B1, membrane-associated n=1 Tax=Eurytemora carolleeae TaxID=1294199 RepID=UPI000C769911|nr:phospholipase B1, membrane-associated [Eurytemora carolleeae]|eukprot:XP_023322665.1 phospholipase B1, membrane-associated-like [Eurytemora affinis]
MDTLLFYLGCILMVCLSTAEYKYVLQRQEINSDESPPTVPETKEGMMIMSNFVESSDIVIRKLLKDEERGQCRLEPEQKFPCKNIKSSKHIPDSVHKLRPADIQVVAALGDSITVGVGAGAESVLDIGKRYRGVSFSSGGAGTWRDVVTLPNILKIFNPYLYGASSNMSSGLNYARAGATSKELLSQAKRLVHDMYRDPRINVHKDWKMITILIGMFVQKKKRVDEFEDASVEGYGYNIRRALDYLYRHLPRTFVNLVPMADVTLTLDLVNKPGYCYLLHWYFCPCLFDDIFSKRMSKWQMKTQLRHYMNKIEHLINMGMYDNRDDFTVVIQPSLVNGIIPKKYDRVFKRKVPDLSYLAPDCFHFSQKLHALVSRSLWNNLLQPVGQKATDWSKQEVPFLCPSSTAPFLATRKNSSLARRTRGSLMLDWLQFIRGSPKYTCTI